MDIKMKTNNLTDIRRSLIYGIPSILFVLVFSIWNTENSFLKTIADLKNSAPSVRITPGDLVGVYFPIMGFTILVSVIQKAIPCKASTQIISERILAISVITGGGIMLFCLLVVTPFQYYAMPRLGYTRCNILEGHPNIYFSDWVKNPDWCVRGKSREWVNEQARLGGSPELNP